MWRATWVQWMTMSSATEHKNPPPGFLMSNSKADVPVVEGVASPSLVMPSSALTRMYSSVCACLARIRASLRVITVTSGSSPAARPRPRCPGSSSAAPRRCAGCAARRKNAPNVCRCGTHGRWGTWGDRRQQAQFALDGLDGDVALRNRLGANSPSWPTHHRGVGAASGWRPTSRPA